MRSDVLLSQKLTGVQASLDAESTLQETALTDVPSNSSLNPLQLIASSQEDAQTIIKSQAEAAQLDKELALTWVEMLTETGAEFSS